MSRFFQAFILCALLVVAGCDSYSSRRQPVMTDHTIQKRGQSASETLYRQPPPATLGAQGGFGSLFSPAPSRQAKVALLLPLSGPYADTGKNLLDAAEMALFSLNQPGISLMPIDTKGTSFGAAEAARKAVAEQAVLALGPVFGPSADAVAPLFKQAGIEFITFSNDEKLADSGALLIGVSPQQQIRKIMEYAIESQQIRHYAVLAPNNALGAVAARLVREKTAQYGGASLIKTEIYLLNHAGQGRDLKKHVRDVLSALTAEKASASDRKALLIEGSAEDLRKIAVLLEEHPRFNPQNIQILGTMRMDEPALLSQPAYQGAVFVSLPHQRKEEFAQRFAATYGYRPLSIASLAYDGVALAATLNSLAEGDFSKDKITDPRGFSGVDGIFRIKGNGLPERGLSIVQIQDGALREIAPAPGSFYDGR